MMTQNPPTGPVVPVKPQANVYTVLIIIGILVLGTALFMCLNSLLNSYGLEFGQIFDPNYKIPPLAK